MSILDNIKSGVSGLWDKVKGWVSNVINKGKDILDEWAAQVAWNVWEFLWYDWDEVLERARANPLSTQVQEDWDNTIASEVIEDTADSVKKFAVDLTKYITTDHPPMGISYGISAFWDAAKGAIEATWIWDWGADFELDRISNYWQLPRALWSIATLANRRRWIDEDWTEEWKKISSLQDTIPWIINSMWLWLDVAYTGEDTDTVDRTPWQQQIALAISGTKDNIDWGQFYRDSWNNKDQAIWAFNSLSIYSDENLQKAAEATSIQTGASIEDTIKKFQDERAEVFKSVFDQSATGELTQADMSSIANAASIYITEYQQAQIDYEPIYEKEELEFYKRHYPTTWEDKVADKEKEKVRREEIGKLWLDAFPEASKYLNSVKWDITIPYAQRVKAVENFWELINTFTITQLDNENFADTLTNMWESAWLPVEEIKAIEAKIWQYGQNYTYYMERVYLNYGNVQDNNQAQDLADVDYIKNKILPTLADWQTMDVKWVSLTKADIEAIADGTYKQTMYDISESGSDKIRRDLAAQLVVEGITDPLRSVTINWEEHKVKLEQWTIWEKSAGMEWISYIQAQIKSIVRDQYKNSVYHKLWYDLFEWVSNVFWWTAQTTENAVAQWMRTQWDSNAISVLSKIWDTNRLNFDRPGWNLDEWWYNITSFMDEYWETALDIPLILASWWTSWALTAARKWVSLSRNWANLIRIGSTTRQVGMWRKLVTLWNYMQDMSATIHSNKFIQYLDNLANLTMPSRDKMLFSAWDLIELEKDWSKVDSFIRKAALSTGRKTTLWDFWREVLDGMVQDRIIANFILGKMDTDYTEWDVWADTILTIWIAPIAGLVQNMFWMSNKTKEAKWLLDFISWKDSREANREVVEMIIKNQWLVENQDYMKLADWRLVPANNATLQKFLDATRIANGAVNMFNKELLKDPVNASRRIAEWLNEASVVNYLKTQWATNNVTRSDVDNLLNSLKNELDVMNNWWSEATILAKYFSVNGAENNVFKTPNSATIIWWQSQPMMRQGTSTDIKTIFWITDEELNAWIPQSLLDSKSAENGVDYSKIFSRTEITNDDWTTEVVYKYWWFNNTEIWFNNATDGWLETLIDWLPTTSKQDVAIITKLAQDLDSEINC